jgi:hypothetical protein
MPEAVNLFLIYLDISYFIFDKKTGFFFRQQRRPPSKEAKSARAEEQPEHLNKHEHVQRRLLPSLRRDWVDNARRVVWRTPAGRLSSSLARPTLRLQFVSANQLGGGGEALEHLQSYPLFPLLSRLSRRRRRRMTCPTRMGEMGVA